MTDPSATPLGIDEILWSWGPGESRFALLTRGRLTELVIDRPTLHLGSRFLGRVVALDRALNAAFVDLGIGGRPGFLPGAAALNLSEGASVAVTIRAEVRAGKGPLLSPLPDASLVGQAKAPVLLSRPPALKRLLEAHPGIRRVRVDDPVALAEAKTLAPALAEGHRDGPLFSLYRVEEEIESALAPVVMLAGGGRMTIENTAALTAIDVDSGGGRADEANRKAVAAIARHLRLRGIGGQVVIDFVSVRRGSPHRLADALKEAVAADPVPTQIFGVSRLGLVELTRERRGLALSELLCECPTLATPETVALAALRQVLAEAACRPGRPLGLVVAPEVAKALALRPDALEDAEARLCRPLPVRVAPDRTREDISIEEITG
ncbi:ribonuclease E/G [Magnetospirillum molischianum]|uniref:Ribonuclease G and E n=1 Tax=Magnetospirillum molischianum DSM 120 TaxID=1150626 RepID=H8FQ88_MAGML|nr:ribonuclease E/G [Magnetospirillum molischianum]CCG40526.1 Ribonuclease G and E [Magnetospirillum molischianum DSM 120]